jgi:hypothetical protein
MLRRPKHSTIEVVAPKEEEEEEEEEEEDGFDTIFFICHRHFTMQDKKQ